MEEVVEIKFNTEQMDLIKKRLDKIEFNMNKQIQDIWKVVGKK